MQSEFPDIHKNQFALLRAEQKTGTVLKEDLEYALDSSQKVYTIFDDLVDAQLEAVSLISNNPNVECWIYNYRRELIMLIDRNDLA